MYLIISVAIGLLLGVLIIRDYNKQAKNND